MEVRLKYPMKVAGVLVPANTVVEALRPDDVRVQKLWPGIGYGIVSAAVAVQFDHVPHPTLVHSTQIEEVK